MNSFDEKYKANIAGLAKANNVDMSVAADMLRSNLAGTTQYKGGGVLDYVQANKDLQAFRSQDTQKPKQKTSQTDLYALQEKKRLQALESARQKALASLKAEKEQINPYYNQALSVVGGQSNLGAKNLQEYLAQRGQTNAGVSAQAELNRQATLNTNFANIENERARRFSDIARRETEVQNAYDEGVMQAALDRQISEAQAIQAAQASQAQYEQELRMLGYKNELASQLAYEKAQYDLERELAKIQAKFQVDSQLMQMKPRAVSGGGSTGGGGGANLTKDQAFYQDMQLVNKGSLSPEQIESMSMELIGQYGLSKYKQLLEAAKNAYVPFSGVADFRILAGEQ
jgi:hypothetical protein